MVPRHKTNIHRKGAKSAKKIEMLVKNTLTFRMNLTFYYHLSTLRPLRLCGDFSLMRATV